MEKEKEYWLKRFENGFDRSSFAKRERHGISMPEYKRYTGKISSENNEKFLILTNGSEIRMLSAIMAITAVVLHKYTENEEITIGTSILKQELTGKALNLLLPVKTEIKVADSFKQLLIDMRNNIIKASENQNFSMERLVFLTGQEYFTENVFTIFDTAVILENIQDKSYLHGTNPSVIFLYKLEENKLKLVIEYDMKTIEEKDISILAGHIEKTFTDIFNDLGVSVEKIDILSHSEKRMITHEFNNTEAEYDGNVRVHELFEKVCKANPDRTAVLVEDEAMTYGELNKRANKIAVMLRENGAGPNKIVGISVERSFEMIIGIMGILKAGAAYLPIDPRYPDSRRDYMLKDSGAEIMLLNSKFNDIYKANEIKKVILDDEANYAGDGKNLNVEGSSKDMAYIIYTSGSTGEPKGTMIQHFALVNRLNWMQKHYSLQETDVILQKTTFNFDVSVWELLWWSIYGAKVCFLRTGAEGDSESIIETIEKRNVSVMHFVPSMLTTFLNYAKEHKKEGKLKSLKQVFSSGEALPPAQVKLFNGLLMKENGTRLTNLYGPTEATIDVTYFNCWEKDEYEIVPIGKPIDNTKMYIINKYKQMQPIGLAGELCIAGDGLSLGYLNKEELTKEKFINNPFEEGKKLYRTGDLARWMPDGNIEFLGRIDFQVKLRGFRVELSEIEKNITRFEGIKEAVTINEGKNENAWLSAFFTSDENVDTIKLREYLSEKLPDYMIPSYLVQLEKIPLNFNGKADRKALALIPKTVKSNSVYEAPKNEIEKEVQTIWKKILKIEELGINDSFFENGGDSLKAVSAQLEIFKKLNVQIGLKTFFEKSTIKEIGMYIEQNMGKNIYSEVKKVGQKNYYPINSAQKRIYNLNKMENISTAFNMTTVMKIEGKLDILRFEKAVGEIIKRHEILRTSFIEKDGEVYQITNDEIEDKPIFLKTEAEEINSAIKQFVREFDVGTAPLFRNGLIEVDKEHYVWIFDAHILIADYGSRSIFINEVLSKYYGEKLEELPIQFKDFVEWQNEEFSIEKIFNRHNFWKNEFSEEMEVLKMPLDFERPETNCFQGNVVKMAINEEITSKMAEFAKNKNLTVYIVCISIYKILLSKYTNQKNIILWSGVAGRNHNQAEKLIGSFAYSVPIKKTIDSNNSFEEFIGKVKNKLMNVYEHQYYPFDLIVNNSEHEFRDSVLSFVNAYDTAGGATSDRDLKVSNYDYLHDVKDRDFVIDVIYRKKGDLYLNLLYRTDLFKETTMKMLLENYNYLAEQIINNPGKKISDYKLKYSV